MATSITKARKILGQEYHSMTDEQIEMLIEQLTSIASTVLETIEASGSKVSAWVIDDQVIGTQNGEK